MTEVPSCPIRHFRAPPRGVRPEHTNWEQVNFAGLDWLGVCTGCHSNLSVIGMCGDYDGMCGDYDVVSHYRSIPFSGNYPQMGNKS